MLLAIKSVINQGHNDATRIISPEHFLHDFSHWCSLVNGAGLSWLWDGLGWYGLAIWARLCCGGVDCIWIGGYITMY